MESGYFLTKRGRRMLQVLGAGLTWTAAFLLLTAAAIFGTDAARGFGLGLSAVAAAWTVCLAISRHSDLVREAFRLGKEVGLDSVRQLHQR